MKRLLLLALIIGMISGCASATYRVTDGTKVTEVIYNRFLTTADFLKAKVGEANINIGKQQIDTALLQSVLGLATAAAGAK
jgi:phage-related protein